MNYETLLNERQLAAVETNSQFVRIIAGAGSGKTRVLTYRIAFLVAERHVDPSRILAIAFTNKVAGEMKDRAAKLVGTDLAPFLHVSTFHAFCARFLRAEAKVIGYPNAFTIYDEKDQEDLVKTVAAENGYRKGDQVVKEALQYIRNKKCKGLYPEDISLSRDSYQDEKLCLKFYLSYEQKKTSMYAFDFDDLLLKTIQILENFPLIQNVWRNRIDHVLVDEFQDTNDVQFKLMNLLLRPDAAVYVVGDPDQTIYTWRGANQSIIMDFDKRFPGAETIILDRNYRSTKNILDAANKLIAHNKKRVPKNLYTTEEDGEKIETNKLYSAEAEAHWVVDKIASVADRQKDGDVPNYKNIAVLYRSSYVTRPFESEFAARGIPYRIFGGLRFYERKEVKDVLAYFRLLLNPLDNISFERIINVPVRGIGDVSVQKIREEALARGVSEYDYLKGIEGYADESDLSGKVVNSLTLLLRKMEATKGQLLENLEVYSSVLKNFVTDIGYFDYIAADEELNEDRVGNVNALFDDLTSYIKNNPTSTFDEYLENVSLLTSQDDMNDGDYVSLMTIHTAKGLEFDYVFVIAMNEGSFPSMRAESESGHDGKEEERRLAYVAMTRAKKKLFMTCNMGYSYVTDSKAIPSEFFDDAGLAFPHTQPHSDYEGDSGWGRHPSASSASFFSDGDSLTPFASEKQEAAQTAPKSNGILDWKIGDVAEHEKFGEGIVREVIDQSIIVVDFAAVGKKTLLATHPMLSRKNVKGGQA